MKKLIILILFAPLFSSAQNIDTVSAPLTLQLKHWLFAIGKHGDGNEAASRSRIRSIRVAIRAANPSTMESNVTVSNVPGYILLAMYESFLSASFGEVFNLGNTQSERVMIYTNIRAINNSVLQQKIGQIDGRALARTNSFISNGQSIVIDP